VAARGVEARVARGDGAGEGAQLQVEPDVAAALSAEGPADVGGEMKGDGRTG
jgi:hypothetical protein